ncbi:MAG: glycerol-3-phosphate 1-O-acyltransferase PlsY [Candidatus Acidiferrales bacterium]
MSAPLIPHWAIPVIAYLLGSIPFGYLIVKMGQGRDVRGSGSGNIGAANVTRVAGTAAGIATLALDAAKGYFAVWIARRGTGGSIRWMILAALVAVLGHLFPVWLKFRGGKGVATGIGVFIPICLQAVFAAVVIWIIVVVFWRYVSLGSIIAAAAMPMLLYVLYAPGHAPPNVVSFGAVLISVMVILKHRANVGRLINGTENRISFPR